MSTSNIEWTDRVWNPVTGCTKVSAGCKNCYAEGVAARFWGSQYVHTVERGFIATKDYRADHMDGRRRKFTDVMTHDDRLLEPLKWKKPARVFVNSMSDLFHEDVPYQFVANVVDVIAKADRHTFQVLTKRPKRMHHFFAEIGGSEKLTPPPNLWLGVSVENQETADARIPVLLDTPAAVRFVSYEPALGPVDFRSGGEVTEVGHIDWLLGFTGSDPKIPRVDWVIVGGESGHGARPFDIAWARATVEQCKAAGVPVFVKQMGANSHGYLPDARDFVSALAQVGAFVTGKGGDPAEWPEDLRVRQFPTIARSKVQEIRRWA